MLLGRWLQERAVERNRAWLLASDGTDGLLARRVREGRVELVRCAEIASGDALLVAPGDLVPVDGAPRGTRRPSRSTGSSARAARGSTRGARSSRPARSRAGTRPRLLRATTAFDASPLRELLRTPERRGADAARTTPWFQRLAKLYVVGVLAVAAAGFVAWWLATRDVSRALAVTTAVLVVTCPCAFGIAAPLAYEMVQAGLRRAGLFVRRASFLDRARDVRRVVFDKTGTLTTGALALANPEVLGALHGRGSCARSTTSSLAAGTRRAPPCARRSRARHVTLDERARVVEQPGRGLELVRAGRRWRLGDAGLGRGGLTEATARTSRSASTGACSPTSRTTERLRPDAAREVRALDARRLRGVAPQRRRAGAGRRRGRRRAAFLANARSASRPRTARPGSSTRTTAPTRCSWATASTTPRARPRARLGHAGGRPPVRPGPRRLLLRHAGPRARPPRAAQRSRPRASRARGPRDRPRLQRVRRWPGARGRMSPLLCAVLMPASSLTTIAATVAALSPRSRLWRS